MVIETDKPYIYVLLRFESDEGTVFIRIPPLNVN